MIMRLLMILALMAVCVFPQNSYAAEAKKSGWQCVTYVRAISPVKLFGNAWTWWQQAASKYQRGHDPKVGSVLVFQKSPSMRSGHVALVRQKLNDREILIEHANWAPAGTSGRGKVTTDAKVIDVSPANDWTEVRVWYEGAQTFGRVNYSYGFIYSPDYDPDTGITWDNG